MAEPPEYTGLNDDVLEPFPIDEDILIYLISQTEQPAELNVRMVKEGVSEEEEVNEESNDEDEDWKGWIILGNMCVVYYLFVWY